MSVLKTLKPGGCKVIKSHGVSVGCLAAILAPLVDRRPASHPVFLQAMIRRIADVCKANSPFGIASTVADLFNAELTEADVAACLDGRLVLHSRTLLGYGRTTTRFASKRDVIDAMLDSCCIPMFTYLGFRWHFDGLFIPEGDIHAARLRATGGSGAVIAVVPEGCRAMLNFVNSIFYKAYYADQAVNCEPIAELLIPAAGCTYEVCTLDASVRILDRSEAF